MVFFVSIGFFSKIGAIVKEAAKGGGAVLTILLGFFIVEALMAVFLEFWFHTFWYITPGFINDAVFWFQMYIVPLCMIAKDLGLLKQ